MYSSSPTKIITHAARPSPAKGDSRFLASSNNREIHPSLYALWRWRSPLSLPLKRAQQQREREREKLRDTLHTHIYIQCVWHWERERVAIDFPAAHSRARWHWHCARREHHLAIANRERTTSWFRANRRDGARAQLARFFETYIMYIYTCWREIAGCVLYCCIVNDLYRNEMARREYVLDCRWEFLYVRGN